MESVTDIKGIGKGIGGLISEAVLNGSWGNLGELYDKIPPGLIEMTGIPSLGPKRVRLLYEELNIDSLKKLKIACENNKIASLQGFGVKSQEKYLEGIELLRRYQGRSRMDIGLAYGRSLEDKISQIPNVLKAQLAGSARRMRETIGDLDIVLSAKIEHQEKIINQTTNFTMIMK